MLRITHPVRTEQSWLCHCGHDLPARTHAEAVHGRHLPIGVGDQRIIGVAQTPEVRVFAKACEVHEGLGVFDAQTDLEGLGFDGKALFRQGPNGVPRAMTQREHDRITGKSALRCLYRMHTAAVVAFQRFEAGIEMESHTHRFELRSQPRQDSVQAIRPDMRASVECDFGIGTCFDQRLKDRDLECVLSSGVELSIGIGPRSTLSEEEIALRIERPRSLKSSDCPTALAERGSAIDQIHAHSVARQTPGGIQACRPGSDDDDTARQPSSLEGVKLEADRGFDASGASALDGTVEGFGSKARVEIEVDVNHESKLMSTAATSRVE